ncbi:hypothetical protein QBC47DRAFT_393492 [Echria macrotheca]|uniref:Uncharacterized protein n=1 Tax=Echria macrotheca TaxID=438768 RepID=A0AAJ0F728_9PEZI|nr:hypothetical protein QBC47DRAFT_393492 [Echria macrotheca]
MCMQATCPTCSKTSWRGCGSHIPSVFASIPEDKWCTCEPRTEVGGKQYPPMAKMNFGLPTWMTGWMGGASENATSGGGGGAQGEGK